MQSAAPSQNQSAPVAGGSRPALVHWLLTVLVTLNFALVFARVWTGGNLADQGDWQEATLISLATAGTIVAALRRLPMQNILWAALIIAVIGGGAHALGALTDLPFGPFLFAPEAGPKLFKTLPWAMPLLWIFAVLNSRGVARLVLRPWRKTKTYGFWVIGFTTALVMLFDFALDPFASKLKHYWLWTPTRFPITWQGAPLVNFLSWAVLSLLILAFITPLLINKRPRGRSSPDFHPLGLWLGALLLFGGTAAANGFWPVAVVDAIIGIVTAVFAIRGAAW